MERLLELRESEEKYVANLEFLIQAYGDYMHRSLKDPNLEPMPDGLKNGKYKFVLSNVEDVLSFHKRHAAEAFERGVKQPRILLSFFQRYEKDFKHQYGKFCTNRNKFNVILEEYDDYFTTIWDQLQCQASTSLNSCETFANLLITPVQRFPKYLMIFQDAQKDFERQNQQNQAALIEKIIAHVEDICHYINDMIDVGYITDFKGDLFSQGELRLKDDLALMKKAKRFCWKGFIVKGQGTIFIFEKLIIVCQKVERAKDVYEFKTMTVFKTNLVNTNPIDHQDFELHRRQKYVAKASSFAPLRKRSTSNLNLPFIRLRCQNPHDQILILETIQAQVDSGARLASRLANPTSRFGESMRRIQRKTCSVFYA